jgi:hypothetical protein
MGKRRTEMEHKMRPFEDDDDEDEVEEEVERVTKVKIFFLFKYSFIRSFSIKEPLTEEQISNIKARKKIVAKRRITSTTASTTDSTENIDKPSVFTGFKGFSSFKSAEPVAEKKEISKINGDNKPLVTSFLTTQPITTTPMFTSTIATGVSAKPSSQTGTFSALKTTTDTTESSKNIGEVELRFMNGLNDLYERCYGKMKKEFKIPSDSSIESISDPEAKYAYLLGELNKYCSKWISKHVEENPMIVLTPVFVDYFNYLIQLEKQFFPNTFKKLDEKVINGNGVAYQNGHKDETTSKETVELTASSKKFADMVSSQPMTPINLGAFVSPSVVASSTSTSTAPFSFKPLENVKPSTTPGEQNEPAKPTEIPTSTFMPKSSQPETQAAKAGLFQFSSTISTPLTSSLADKEKTATISTLNDKKNQAETTQTPSLFSFSASKPSEEKPSEIAPTKPAGETKSLFSFGSITPASEEVKSSSESVFKFGSAAVSTTTPKPTASETVTKPSIFASLNTQQTTTPSFKFGSTPAETSTEKKPTEIEQKPSIFFSLLNKPATDSAKEEGTSQIFKPFAGFGQIATSTTSPQTTTTTTTSTTPSIFSSIKTDQPSTTPFFNLSNVKPGGLFSSGIGEFGKFGGGGGASHSAEGGEGAGEETEEPYEPPKPETVEAKEDGSVFQKRIKLFYFNEKEKKFSDRGIGNLFIKPINDGEKTQLIVRADTTLANILLNVKLDKVFPVSKEGAKDVSYICIPNPKIPGISDAPCKFLFKVKTPEDASELFEKLNEYKK